jgi:hypothetical protein
MNPIIVVFVIVSILVMFMFTYGKRVQADRLIILNECREYEQFDKVADSFLTKLLVKHYDLETLKLNSFISRGDRKQTDSQFELLLNAAQNPRKYQSLLIKAFEYYTYEKNSSKANELLKLIKDNTTQQTYEFCQREYDIVIDHSTKYITELTEEAEQYSGQRKLVTLYLLQLSYENAGNTAKVKEIEKTLKNQHIS